MEAKADFTQVNRLVSQLDFDKVDGHNISVLNEINSLIKLNEAWRRNLTCDFYSKIKSKLHKLTIKRFDRNDEEDECLMILRCLRNSAALVNKSDFSIDENEICKFLISFIENTAHEQHETPICITILQYFINLAQGKKKLNSLPHLKNILTR
jgi:hypothetical protein